jgi:hypothetical protein
MQKHLLSRSPTLLSALSKDEATDPKERSPTDQSALAV